VRVCAAINTYKPFVMNDYATQCNFVQMVRFPLLTDRLKVQFLPRPPNIINNLERHCKRRSLAAEAIFAPMLHKNGWSLNNHAISELNIWPAPRISPINLPAIDLPSEPFGGGQISRMRVRS
jgi:hypothetical protein